MKDYLEKLQKVQKIQIKWYYILNKLNNVDKNIINNYLINQDSNLKD